jgi:hypothetical protein
VLKFNDAFYLRLKQFLRNSEVIQFLKKMALVIDKSVFLCHSIFLPAHFSIICPRLNKQLEAKQDS